MQNPHRQLKSMQQKMSLHMTRQGARFLCMALQAAARLVQERPLSGDATSMSEMRQMLVQQEMSSQRRAQPALTWLGRSSRQMAVTQWRLQAREQLRARLSGHITLTVYPPSTNCLL
jgi:hypothetical protein